MPDPTPTYRFDPFLESLSDDWYTDDDLLHRLLDRFAPDADRHRLERFGPVVAGRLRTLAEASAEPEHAPRLVHRDAYDHRVDRIALADTTEEALAIAHGDFGLGAVRGDPFVHYALIYLLAQNGEAGVACSLACTDGLVRALDALGDRPVHHDAVAEVRDSDRSGYAHAAQFVTEIQGGSDVPANVMRAVPDPAGDPDTFRLHGQKWFCSNINADWFLVTARPEAPAEGAGAGSAAGAGAGAGAESPGPVGLFLVPAYESGRRNGYRIERLKDKLGTRELATAEVTFDGAVAWPVGAPERGVANLLRYVLTPSRFACVLFAASALRRAERIVDEYTRFREAFGQPIARYPLVARTLEQLTTARAEALTALFELLRLWQDAEAARTAAAGSAASTGSAGDAGSSGGRPASPEARADFRILLSLAKPVLTQRATASIHEAMMLLAGNGIEERFSPLPRLYRDSVIMETWEGPHNVLITQALRDLVRFDVDPAAFMERVAGEPRPELADALAAAMHDDDTLRLADLAPAIIQALAGPRRATPEPG